MATSLVYDIKHNLDEKSPRIDQPDKILIPLKEHQKTIIYHARKLESLKPYVIGSNKQMVTQLGVICDHVGAGKSYEVLGTIASAPSLSQTLKFQKFNDLTHYTIYPESKKIDTNIIVVPHGVFKQWEDYISKSTKLNFYLINNFQALKNILKNYLLDELYEDTDTLDEPTVNGLINNLRSCEYIKNGTSSFTPNTLSISYLVNSAHGITPQNLPKQVRDTKYYRYLEPYYNDHPDKERIINQYGQLDTTKLQNTEILLVSATLYNELAFYMIKDKYFVNRLIFDEADSINIPNTLKIESIFYWFVTSSYMSLCNPDGIEKTVTQLQQVNNRNHYYGHHDQTVREVVKKIKEKGIKCNGFIKDTFKMYEGDIDRGNYYLKNDDAFIEMSFKLPELIEHLLVCRDNIQIKVLNGVVSNDVLLMLNAGDTEGAIGRLSCEKGSEDNIIKAVTQKLEQKILEFKEELKEKQTKEYVTPKAKQEALERTQAKIQETREKIKLIEERIKGVDCCDICFDDINNPAVTGCCQNVFCFSCLAIAISGKNICPKCRDSLTLDKIMIINKKANESEGDDGNADADGDGTGDGDGVDGGGKKNVKDEIKLRELALKEVLDNSLNNDKYTNFEKILEYKVKNFPKEKRKILVFSEHEGSFNAKITGSLDKFNINYSRIKGTSASINKTLREYRGDDLKPGDKEIDVLLINSRFFGAGLNLQNSSDIIILHRQGADLLHQIIGRAQRIGRKDSLRVWKLYFNNEAYNYVE
jgi:hypothetical protein